MGRLSWRELGARPLVFPALSLVLGAWLGAGADAAPDGRGTGLAGAAFLAAGLALLLACALGRRVPGAHLGVLVGLGLGGAGLARLEARVVLPPLPPDRAVWAEGRVERSEAVPGGGRLVVALGRVDGAPARVRASVHVRGDGRGLPLPGQRVGLRARLGRSDAPPDNPGVPDTAPARRRRALVLRASVAPEALVPLSPPPVAEAWAAATRTTLGAAVRRVAPDPDAAALYLTLSAGERAALGAELEDAFGRSGLAHVLSVSGLHVAALAFALLAALRWALVAAGTRLRRVDARRLAAPLAVPLVWGYVAFTGWQPPAVRSAVMASAVLLGLALWRRADALNALAAAALALVVVAPSAVADLSLQLSFLAVLALLALSPALREALPVPRPSAEEARPWARRLARAREAVVQTLCASAATTLAGAPLVAAAFGRVSVAGLLSNVACLPLGGVLTLLAAGGAALHALWAPLALPVLWAGTWGCRALVEAARLFAALPGGSPEVRAWPAWAAALWALGLLVWALGEGRWRRLGALAPAALAGMVAASALRPLPALRVTFLAVGQGDAVVLQSRDAVALVDGGGAPGGADPGARVVRPYLAHAGVERLALAVLSHPHPDHALGLASVLPHVPARALWLAAGTEDGALSRAVVEAARAGAPDVAVEAVEAGRAPFQLGEATLEVLGPPRDRLLLEGVNDHSVVLRVRHGAVTLLLLGDAEAAAEDALLGAGVGGPVTLVKAGHHGSRTSSGQALVDATRPRHVVFCVGRENRFGFPHAEVAQRWAAAGAQCLRTDLDGAVTLESDGRDVRLSTWLPRGPGPEAPSLAGSEGRAHLVGDDLR